MFKNYLTYQFAQNFDRACRSPEITSSVREPLIASSEKMLDHFARSITAKSPAEELRLLGIALIHIRDCREILDQANLKIHDIDCRYEVLHGRLEQLVSASADAAQPYLRSA